MIRQFQVGAFVGAGLLVACSGWAQPAPVGHNTLEYVYVQVAKRLAWASKASGQFYPSPETLPDAIALCGKINPDAVDFSVAFGGFESWSYRYMRSYCFHEIATSAQAPELCERVRVLDRPPPRRFFLGRNIPITPAACRDGIGPGRNGIGWAEFGNEMILLLLGYSRDEITAAANGRLPEQDGAGEFMSALVPTTTDDEELAKRSADFLKRLQRLPDFARGDEAARRQLDALAPGWASPQTQSRLALALRCAIERLAPGTGLSNECLDRM